jgi:hypothetical protein
MAKFGPNSMPFSKRHRYGAIYADPPWSFRNWSAKGTGRNAVSHYDCLNFETLAAYEVASSSAPSPPRSGPTAAPQTGPKNRNPQSARRGDGCRIRQSQIPTFPNTDATKFGTEVNRVPMSRKNTPEYSK